MIRATCCRGGIHRVVLWSSEFHTGNAEVVTNRFIHHHSCYYMAASHARNAEMRPIFFVTAVPWSLPACTCSLHVCICTWSQPWAVRKRTNRDAAWHVDSGRPNDHTFGGSPERCRRWDNFWGVGMSRPIFNARCYASAVLAMALCLSVCLSVRHKSEFY